QRRRERTDDARPDRAFLRARVEREGPSHFELRRAHESTLPPIERVGERRCDAQADLGTLAHQLLESLARETPDTCIGRRLDRGGASRQKESHLAERSRRAYLA